MLLAVLPGHVLELWQEYAFQMLLSSLLVSQFFVSVA